MVFPYVTRLLESLDLRDAGAEYIIEFKTGADASR